MFTFRFSLRTNIYGVNKKKGDYLPLFRLIEMYCRSFSFTNDKTKKKQKDTATYNQVLRALYSKKNERERKRIVCCMWHMELLVVDTRRQAAVID